MNLSVSQRKALVSVYADKLQNNLLECTAIRLVLSLQRSVFNQFQVFLCVIYSHLFISII